MDSDVPQGLRCVPTNCRTSMEREANVLLDNELPNLG